MPQTLRRALRALFSPVLAVGRAYNETAKRAPMTTGVVTTVIKTSAADYFAQKVIERRDEVDWKRNALFSGFGFAYLGCFQFWLYNDLFTKITPSLTRMVGTRGLGLALTFLDQCVHHPVFYFPSFYALKGLVEGRTLGSSMKVYREDLWENCKALWTVWVPAQLVNFSVVPLHLRIPFVAAVSFGWTVIISVMRGNLSETFEDPAEVPIMLQHHHQVQAEEQPAEGEPQQAAEAAAVGPSAPSSSSSSSSAPAPTSIAGAAVVESPAASSILPAPGGSPLLLPLASLAAASSVAETGHAAAAGGAAAA